MPPLWAHRQQRHQLPGQLRGRFGLLSGRRSPKGWLAAGAGLTLMLTALPGARGEGFGRWDTALKDCSLVQGHRQLPLLAQRQPCQRLRLEQNLEGLLSVRLQQPSGSQRFGSQSLVFGGVLAAGGQPMRCGSSGVCKPRWPIRLEVATVASSLPNDQGVAPALPLAQLARGTCLLERRSLQCQAHDANGRFWEASASL